MSDKEIWLILYQALLSGAGWPMTTAEMAAWADQALEEYKKRWPDGR